MIIFYIIIISNLYHKKKQVDQKISLLSLISNVQVYGGENSTYTNMVNSISRTLAILITVYLICLVPAISFMLGQWPPQSKLAWYMFYIFNPV